MNCNDKVNIAKLLLDEGAEINKKDFRGCNAYYYSKKEGYGCEELSKLLEKNGANTTVIPNEDSLLIIAIKKLDIAKIKDILSKGININLQNKNGKTALDYAIEANNAEIAKLLLVNGAYFNKEEILATLIKKNINIEIIRIFIDFGANINGLYKYYDWDEESNPLEIAIKKNKYHIARLLLNSGAKTEYIYNRWENNKLKQNIVDLRGVALQQGSKEIQNLLKNYNDPFLKEVWNIQEDILKLNLLKRQEKDDNDFDELKKSVTSVFYVLDEGMSQCLMHAMVSIFRSIEIITNYYIKEEDRKAKWKDNNEIILNNGYYKKRLSVDTNDIKHVENENNKKYKGEGNISIENKIRTIMREKLSLHDIEDHVLIKNIACKRNHEMHRNKVYDKKDYCKKIIEKDLSKDDILDWFRLLQKILVKIDKVETKK